MGVIGKGGKCNAFQTVMKINDKERCGLHSTLHTNNLVLKIPFMGL